VARVAGDAAGAAALQEMAAFLASARAEGRLLVRIPLHQIEAGHLERDRLMPDDPAGDEDMQALVESLRARGQQVPIDVVAITADPRERYGLISGLRRLTALRMLRAETGEARFGHVTARIVPREGLPAAYRAMVEENEIRAGLSFYERARIAVKAVEAGVFADLRAALRGLYGNVSRAKRSKIGAFAPVVAALDGALAHPRALSEKRGLALARALEAEDGLADRLRATLAALDAPSPEAEQAALTAAAAPAAGKADPAPGRPVALTRRGDRLILSGPGVDAALEADLAAWLAERG
jgi:ParB-like chromosome segregation protein Spo0J